MQKLQRLDERHVSPRGTKACLCGVSVWVDGRSPRVKRSDLVGNANKGRVFDRRVDFTSGGLPQVGLRACGVASLSATFNVCFCAAADYKYEALLLFVCDSAENVFGLLTVEQAK